MNSSEFNGILETCNTHASRLRWALDTLSVLSPVTPEKLSSLTAIDLAVFDQFIVRFSKLQDTMGAKLLPAVLELTHEEGELSTFIDKINRLEKIGALKSAGQWLKLREMRNQFAHDYPEDAHIQASLLNKAFAMAEALLNTLAEVAAFARRYLN